jgi:hypothetical protein
VHGTLPISESDRAQRGGLGGEESSHAPGPLTDNRCCRASLTNVLQSAPSAREDANIPATLGSPLNTDHIAAHPSASWKLSAISVPFLSVQTMSVSAITLGSKTPPWEPLLQTLLFLIPIVL